MKRFVVQCSWTVVGTMFVEAESEEQAERLAYDADDLPEDREYLDSSFEVSAVYPEDTMS